MTIEELAEFNLFIDLLMSGCVVSRCDDGVYICQRPEGAIDPGDTPCFVISQGEIAAHVRSMTAQESPSSQEEASSSSVSSSGDSSSSTDDDSSDGGAKVVVNVNNRRKRKRHNRH